MKTHKIFEVELIFDFWLTFLLQIFSKNSFCLKNISKIIRPVLAALSVNGLNGFSKIVWLLLTDASMKKLKYFMGKWQSRLNLYYSIKYFFLN